MEDHPVFENRRERWKESSTAFLFQNTYTIESETNDMPVQKILQIAKNIANCKIVVVVALSSGDYPVLENRKEALK